jgi:hypothetical protein
MQQETGSRGRGWSRHRLMDWETWEMAMSRGLRLARAAFPAFAIGVEPVPPVLIGAGFAVARLAGFVVVRPAEAAIEGEYRQRHPASI